MLVMSRAEDERRRTQAADSPMAKHSMNQGSMTRTYQGERRMAFPRKLVRKERVRQAFNQYE